MTSFKTLNNITGWLVFAIATAVLGASAESTGSLWDCGEFISGAFKLQVVHPPGAPIFLLVGRIFGWVATFFSDAPEAPAHAINILSAICTAFAATFICWSTVILGKLALVGRENEPEGGDRFAILGSGLVAGLVTAFCTSIWFSAVEGEVYAMSTFFTCMTLWAMLKWYNHADNAQADRWLVFAMVSTALSIGVHLLSLLTFPALALFYYFKKAKTPTLWGGLAAAFVGVLFIVGVQTIIIAGIPGFWAAFDIFLVNNFGLPFNSGLILVSALFGSAIFGGLYLAHKWNNGILQKVTVGFGLMCAAYLVYGTVVIRANANPPINMNDPSDAVRLLPYLNREQYGERALLRGPHFDAKPEDYIYNDRYGRVGNKYAPVDYKIDYDYSPKDESFFPRMSDYSQGRPALYRKWIDKPTGVPSFGDNIEFMWKYQVNWMYWRYFMWNFSGRQNGEQGLYSWDPSSGNWISGFAWYDGLRLGNQAELTDRMKNDPGKNKYYMIPFFLGLLGLFFHARSRPKDFVALMSLFIITGLGIIIYSNQPPNEPRERDYVLAGSFFTYAIWIGMSVLALYEMFKNGLKTAAAPVAIVLALSAPALMVTQNWDDHNRSEHQGSRDYASNFLNSCEPNAIIFTYGDNDTYPLWYCQEMEGIRKDVRVVNLSLIAVDWYINQLRRKVNESAPIKMSMPVDAIRGFKRTQIPFYAPNGEREMTIGQLLAYLAKDNKLATQGGHDFDTNLPTHNLVLPVNKADVYKYNVISPNDSNSVVADTIRFQIGGGKSTYMLKDELAILDIINSNLWERPIYFAVTCREEKLLGLEDYLQLEGLGLRLVPVKTPNQMQNYGLVGAGRVNTDLTYKNIMERWKWGNFDKKKLFVDRSYMPSIQTMRVAFIRTTRDMISKGDKKRAVELTDKYFEAFPSTNFAYDNFSTYLAQIYAQAGENEKAKNKVKEIAAEMEQQFKFFDSLGDDFMKAGYQQEFQMGLAAVEAMKQIAREMKDDAFLDELTKQFAAWSAAQSPLQFPGISD